MFHKIYKPEITINYTSNVELTATGNHEDIEALKELLTIENTSVTQRLAGIRHKPAFNPYHARQQKAEILELEAKQFVTMYGQNDDGSLSLPPGLWFLGTTADTGHRSSVKPFVHGDERYYQNEIVAEMLKYKRSCVVAATGTGKSLIIRNLVNSYVRMGKRVIVCVPSIELLSQTAERVDSGLAMIGEKKCGRLGDGLNSTQGATVVLSTIQSALKVIDRFDAVIFDETHQLSSESYQSVAAAALTAEFMHGLTATIHRPDGLTPLIYSWCGKPVYEYDYKKAVSEGFLSEVKYIQKRIHSGFVPWKGMHATKEYVGSHSDPQFIASVKILVEKSLAAGRKTIVMFKSIECCDALAQTLGVKSANGFSRGALHDFKAGKTQLLIANVSLVAVGLDIPDVSSIIFCASGRSEITFMQSVGRGTRLAPGKKDCIFVDVIADQHRFRQAAEHRMTIAKGLGII